ncbi:hypothetical protein HMPREF1583_00708 [Gardnerella vaginalis JCP8151B]|nr:hypothetical protein HMPREF1583_00708 [Gardnerella vaginalis JCP8151B]
MARAMRVVGDLADGGELKSTSKEAHHLGEPLVYKNNLADSSAQHPRCNGKSLKYPSNVIGI